NDRLHRGINGTQLYRIYFLMISFDRCLPVYQGNDSFAITGATLLSDDDKITRQDPVVAHRLSGNFENKIFFSLNHCRRDINELILLNGLYWFSGSYDSGHR